MNINDLTIGQAKELAKMFGGGTGELPSTQHVGKKCVIRTYASGVHFGTVAAHNGRQIELHNARRLWRWRAEEGISLSEVAVFGIIDDGTKACVTVPEMTILDAIEIIPASDASASSVELAPVAKPK